MTKQLSKNSKSFPKNGVYPQPHLVRELRLALNTECCTELDISNDVDDTLLYETITLCINTRKSYPRITTVLQKLLQNNGYPITINGDYDSSLKNTIVQFQKDMGIEITGIVDSNGSTWKQLLRPQ